MTNIRDVAKACGVAPITVSAVLNNKNNKVSAETRERILTAIREMGYRPGPAARTLAPQRLNILGVVSWSEDLWGDSYHGRILAAASAVAQEHHQHLLLFARYLWYEAAQQSVRTYADGHCDGMIIFPYRHDEPLKAALSERGLPFVVVGDTCDTEGYTSVDVDNVDGGMAATEHLLEMGHRRIAFIGGTPNMRFSVLRAEGYAAALARRGVKLDPALVSEGEPGIDEGYIRTLALIDLPPHARPTALFCGTDTLAYGALRALAERGIKVPEDISVVGFDDQTSAVSTNPPLTTFRQPYEEIGVEAVKALLGRIAGEETKQILLPGKLIVRESTAPPRKSA